MQDSTQVRAGTPAPAAQVFNDQSIRQVVRLSVGGERIRIKVSNLFGTTPVTFSGVQVAKSVGGSGIDAASSQAVQFGGQASVTLAAGEERMSDAVAMPVAPLADITVTTSLWHGDSQADRPQSASNARCVNRNCTS